jgi:hypothetical protein
VSKPADFFPQKLSSPSRGRTGAPDIAHHTVLKAGPWLLSPGAQPELGMQGLVSPRSPWQRTQRGLRVAIGKIGH